MDTPDIWSTMWTERAPAMQKHTAQSRSVIMEAPDEWSTAWTERAPAIACFLCAAACGSISWWFVANGFLWACFYTCVGAALKRYRSGEVLDKKHGRTPDGYGRWAYNLSITHQAIVLPALALAAIAYGGQHVRMLDWLRAPSKELNPVSRHIFYSTMGSIGKDFWIYGKHLEPWLFVHHVATILGCALCMSLDCGGGLAVANAFIGELSSATYNLHIIRPGIFTKCLRIVCIGSVNVTVLLASCWILVMGNHWLKSAAYFALCVSLFSIRCVELGRATFSEEQKKTE